MEADTDDILKLALPKSQFVKPEQFVEAVAALQRPIGDIYAGVSMGVNYTDPLGEWLVIHIELKRD